MSILTTQSFLPEQQLPKVDPKQVCPVGSPHWPLTETGELVVGVLAEEDVVEDVTIVELTTELEGEAQDWTTSVTVMVGTTVPETVSVTVNGGPVDAVSVAVDVYSVVLWSVSLWMQR